jgi:peptidoglycan/LPS O-acetylase OafA/YrhL
VWCFFLLGHVSYRLWRLVPNDKWKHYGEVFAIALLIIALCKVDLTSSTRDIDHRVMWFFYLSFVVAIPPLFTFTKNLSIDNALGELSYPVYLVHMPVIAVVGYVTGGTGVMNTLFWVLLCAAVLHVLIERPFNKLRASLATDSILGDKKRALETKTA